MNFKRVFIEKKRGVNTEARNLLKDFKGYLNIKGIKEVRVLNLYELINVTDHMADEITYKVLYEPSIDILYNDLPQLTQDEKAFRIEYHKGQYNQREDSAKNLIRDFINNEEIDVKHSKIIIVNNVTEDEFKKIKSYYINPIELREIPLDYFSYEKERDAKEGIEIIHEFIDMDESEIRAMKSEYGIGMDMEDLLFCQSYFKEEKRNPTITELKVIDTYWSDHCRHTTFMTEITDIDIEEGKYKEIFEAALKEYLSSRDYVYGDRKKEKPVCLMDLATINMKEISKKGLLTDKEDTDEVNAASVEIDVDVNGKEEKWLLMFKNETHNHPTEMEPFGGASTCLGGGIRDPLSGRAYVYQAMRITGSGDPRQSFEDTLPGKLPQRKITQTAAEGYSSYGYQIGAASGYINEFYDDGFVAKRLELGALVAAAPKSHVYRGQSMPSDLVILVGGRTGRDGLGGAVGSSKEHTETSLETSGAEVQKGNPPLERKIVRLFRNPEASKMIKKCNDFGAGGVSVAVGELADGLHIDLDKVPLKYPGLDGTEIALSESQERMAIVIDKNDLDRFMALVKAEDLEGTVIAEVTDDNRVVMNWRGKTIVDIKREFLNTNGIRKKSKVSVSNPREEIYLTQTPIDLKDKDIKEAFIENMSHLNTASQKGLIERFDNTVGAGTVLSQFGGKYMLTPQEGMVAKIPVLNGETRTCSIMTCGYDPELSKWSTFHGGYYAVIESIAKAVALGGDYKKIRLTFQEYYERLGSDPSKWGKPFAALLGAYTVQKELDIPSIGGKDSMSGTFEDINVPPSLFSFAVVSDKIENIVSKEFKEIDSKVVLIKVNIDDKGLVDFSQLKKNYDKVKNLIDNNKVLSSSTVKFGGIARGIAEMTFGNKIGFKFDDNVKADLFKPLYGSIIIELDKGVNLEEELKDIEYVIVGKTIEDKQIEIDRDIINLDELIKLWETPLSDVFPINEEVKEDIEPLQNISGRKAIRSIRIAKPKVLIPVFTGTHGEYDMAQCFTKAGAEVDTFVFNTLSKASIEESYRELAKRIENSQIIGLPHGFILGNEPETGGKLVSLVFNNEIVKEAINRHLKVADGLILGIGSGFQGLIKSGLIANGQISESGEESPYIAYNSNGKFTSTFVDIKVVSNLSPWMSGMNTGDIYTVPLATNEGRILINNEEIINSGQIATQFVSNNPTGSELGIESLTSPDGRVLGTIASIDRVGENLYRNIDIKGKHNIFESGVKYFL